MTHCLQLLAAFMLCDLFATFLFQISHFSAFFFLSLFRNIFKFPYERHNVILFRENFSVNIEKKPNFSCDHAFSLFFNPQCRGKQTNRPDCSFNK